MTPDTNSNIASLSLEKDLAKAKSLHDQNDLEKAKAIYLALFNAHPNDTRVLTALGAVCLKQENIDAGIKWLNASLAVDPSQVAALSNLSVALLKKHQYKAALEKVDLAISLNPDFADAYSNRGNVMTKLERLEEALKSYDTAIKLRPLNSNFYNVRAVVLQNLNRLDEALLDYDKSIALQRDNASAYFNKSYLKLLMGDFAQGWRLYEWRWKGYAKKNFRNYPQPLWLGNAALTNKTILIHLEQGLGDFIQLCRYIPMIKSLGAKIIIETHASLMSIASSLDKDATIVEKKKKLPPFDYYCPIMSLPLAFNTTLENIPNKVPYLFIEQEKQKNVHSALAPKTKLRIGLVWSGSLNNEIDSGFWRRRSIQLKLLASLVNLPVEFHSLNKDVTAEDASVLVSFKQIHNHQDELNDFTDTAALVNEMDLIISIDTSVAHLAGALGKPVWIMVPYAQDYRWLIEREDSPWYPTATLFRQQSPGEWASVLGRVEQRLSHILQLPLLARIDGSDKQDQLIRRQLIKKD